MIDTPEKYESLDLISESDRIKYLDPICMVVREYLESNNTKGYYYLPNRIFALAVMELYEEWNNELINRDQNDL